MNDADAKPKTSFLLYYDNLPVWEGLSDSQAGKLIKILHQNSHAPDITDPLVKYAYGILKDRIDTDYAKWLKVCDKKRDNANKRWKKERMQMDANAYK